MYLYKYFVQDGQSPLVGDPIYGIKNENIYRNGQLLHARLIGFIHPTSNKYIIFIFVSL